jgi:hypothetical protein
MSDLDGVSEAAYANGMSPLDWSEFIVRNLIETHYTVIHGRHHNPASYPAYSIELTDDALARRIIGALMDAGWEPRSGKEPA